MITRSLSRDAAFQAVFLTTELLEMILSHLPMKALPLDQRVCRKWRDVIQQNKRLQQKLFFQPREADVCWELSLFPRHKLARITPDEYNEKQETHYVFMSGSLNPLLFDYSKEYGLLERANDSGCEVFTFSSLPPLKDPQASWRRMLVTQPPIDSLFTHYGYAGGPLRCETDDFPDGAWEYENHFLSTVGMLFASAEEIDVGLFVDEESDQEEESEDEGSAGQ